MKRFFDFLIALVILVLLSPILLSLILTIYLKMGRPIFFRQDRPGLNGEIFSMVKFRTMLIATDENGEELSDAERLTVFGRFLRASSLDELPELWNVLKGNMSLVGPRPLLVRYLPLYSKIQARRHDVRPGVTGWAQVNGRNAIDWDEKFALDVWYVDHRNFYLDIKILLLTVKKVLFRDGITSEGSATMSEFTGSKEEELK